MGITLPGYAIMIMGSLFSVMLRPMTRQIYALRSANADRVAAEAAASASIDFRERQLVEVEQRARPILMSVVERHGFSEKKVCGVRLLEGALRDGIRIEISADGAVVPLGHGSGAKGAWRGRPR